MAEVIEAMARALHQNTGWPVPYDEESEVVKRGLRASATAAYNAMRETLVPVGWEYWPAEGNCGMPFMQSNRANMDPRHWTETPLYSLPEIDNG